MGRVCYVSSLLWAEFVMCRVDPIPGLVVPKTIFVLCSYRDYSSGTIDTGMSHPKIISGRFVSYMTKMSKKVSAIRAVQ